MPAGNRALRTLLSLAVMTGLLVALPLDVPQAQAAPQIKVNPAKPIKGERFTVTGSIGGAVARRVILQRRSGSKWKQIASGITSTSGAYQLTAATTRAITVRVLAPAAVVNGGTLSQVVGHTKKVSPTKQRISFTLPKSAYVNQAISAAVKLTPARNHRVVKLQVRKSGRWRDVTSEQASTSTKLTIRLIGSAAGTFTYRVLAVAWKGAGTVASSSRKMTIKPDKSAVDPDARPLTAPEVSKISSYNPATGTLAFANPPASLKTITSGDILPIPPRSGISSGALRKVTSVTRSGSTATVRTTSASVPEAITNIPDGATNIALAVTDPGTFAPASGVSVRSRAVPKLGPTKVSEAGVRPASTHLIELSLNYAQSTGDFEGSLSGTVTLDPYAVMDLNLDWGRLRSFKLGAGVVANTDLTTKFAAVSSAGTKISLGRLTQILTGAIGPVPVWMQNDLELVAEVSASGSITVSTTAAGRFEAGITGTSSTERLSVYTAGTPVTGGIGDFSTSLSASTFVGPKDQISLYSLAGPYLQVGAKASISVTYSATSGWSCGGKLGPHLEAGIATSDAVQALTGISYKLAAEAQFGGIEKEYCDSSGRPIGGGTGGGGQALGISTSSLPDGLVGDPYSTSLAATGGNNSYSWTVTGLPDGLSATAAGYISGTPTTAGTSTVHVTVSSGGAQASSDVLIRVTAPNPKWKQAVSVAAGSDTTCVLNAAGGVKCWGSNLDGQLGNGSAYNSAEPVDVPGLESGVTAIAASQKAVCALTSGGDTYCWGYDILEFTQDGPVVHKTPHLVASNMTAIAGGGDFFCAVTEGRTVKCWGDNQYGQLGVDSGGSASDSPLAVPGLSQVNVISAGGSHACALTDDGAKCWGDNGMGQVTGSASDYPVTPTSVGGGTAYNDIEAGDEYTCAVTTSGTVRCWGMEPGQGFPSAGWSTSPADELSGVSNVAGGERWACARTTAAQVKCWGSYGNPEEPRWHELTTILNGSALQVSIARGYACAVMTDGGVKCWGESSFGEGPGLNGIESPTDHGLTAVKVAYFG